MKKDKYVTLLDVVQEALKRERRDKNIFKGMSDSAKFDLLYSKMRLLEKRMGSILNTHEEIKKALE